MMDSGIPKNLFTDDGSVKFSDEYFSVLLGLDSPADIAREFAGGAADLDDAANVAFAAWHISHNDSHVAVFAPEARA